MNKEALIDLIRKPLVKILTRGILYGMTTWLGMEAAAAQETSTQLSAGAAGLIFFAIGALVDAWHNKKDRG